MHDRRRDVGALGVVVPRRDLHELGTGLAGQPPCGTEVARVLGLLVHALAGTLVLHGDGLHPRHVEVVDPLGAPPAGPRVPPVRVVRVRIAGPPHGQPVGDLGVVVDQVPLVVDEGRQQRNGQVVLVLHLVEERLPPVDRVRLGLERRDQQATVGQPVGRGLRRQPGHACGHGLDVLLGEAAAHVGHQDDREVGIDVVRSLHEGHRVAPQPRVGTVLQLDDVDGESVQTAGDRLPDLGAHVQPAPVLVVDRVPWQGSVPQVAAVVLVLAALPLRVEVLLRVVVLVGLLVVQRHRQGWEVVRQDELVRVPQCLRRREVERQVLGLAAVGGAGAGLDGLAALGGAGAGLEVCEDDEDEDTDDEHCDGSEQRGASERRCCSGGDARSWRAGSRVVCLRDDNERPRQAVPVPPPEAPVPALARATGTSRRRAVACSGDVLRCATPSRRSPPPAARTRQGACTAGGRGPW